MENLFTPCFDDKNYFEDDKGNGCALCSGSCSGSCSGTCSGGCSSNCTSSSTFSFAQ